MIEEAAMILSVNILSIRCLYTINYQSCTAKRLFSHPLEIWEN